MYAVIRTGGKQYRVSAGQRLRVERLPGEPGERVTFTDVLLLRPDGDAPPSVGEPAVADARVEAEILSQGRDRKVLVFKYKNKTRYRRLRGHRQRHTELIIREIAAGGETLAQHERPAAQAEAEAPDAEPPETEMEAAAAQAETEDGAAEAGNAEAGAAGTADAGSAVEEAED